MSESSVGACSRILTSALSFMQALFGKLQQLATVAGDVLLGKEKLQKLLLAKLTETVVMWLQQEQEFWSVLEDDSTPLRPLGLQQVFKIFILFSYPQNF